MHIFIRSFSPGSKTHPSFKEIKRFCFLPMDTVYRYSLVWQLAAVPKGSMGWGRRKSIWRRGRGPPTRTGASCQRLSHWQCRRFTKLGLSCWTSTCTWLEGENEGWGHRYRWTPHSEDDASPPPLWRVEVSTVSCLSYWTSELGSFPGALTAPKYLSSYMHRNIKIVRPNVK